MEVNGVTEVMGVIGVNWVNGDGCGVGGGGGTLITKYCGRF